MATNTTRIRIAAAAALALILPLAACRTAHVPTTIVRSVHDTTPFDAEHGDTVVLTDVSPADCLDMGGQHDGDDACVGVDF